MTTLPSSILFACSMNAVRSPIAQGLLRYFHKCSVYAESVGVAQGEADPFAMAVMEEIEIDISEHQPRSFDQLDDFSFDMIIALSPDAYEKAKGFAEEHACDVLYWPTDDPTTEEGNREMRLQAYRRVREDLRSRILSSFPLPKKSHICPRRNSPYACFACKRQRSGETE